MKLVFATQNSNKLKEVRPLLPTGVQLVSLRDMETGEELPETGRTLEANASQKARYIYEKFGMNCFADDTGLEIAALGGRPGVWSARFAGPACRPEDNIRKVLAELKDVEDRSARFRTVIALIVDGQEYCYEGVVHGTIAREPAGEGGFGYDPVFIPEGEQRTFASMTLEEKNRISHRARAVEAFTAGLEKIIKERWR
jgi:XTP/dITP diphosphohydrolase